jgi:hypothetical protein
MSWGRPTVGFTVNGFEQGFPQMTKCAFPSRDPVF